MFAFGQAINLQSTLSSSMVSGSSVKMYSAKDYISDFGVKQRIFHRFRIFIHVSRLGFLADIRSKGLIPKHINAAPPKVITDYFLPEAVKILCLVPYGARDWPGMTGYCPEHFDEKQRKRISFCIRRESVAKTLGWDWSYSSNFEQSTCDIAERTFEFASNYGTIVTYDPIPSSELLVFANGCSPANPSAWRPFDSTHDDEIILHDD
jgi:hypothetical protein